MTIVGAFEATRMSTERPLRQLFQGSSLTRIIYIIPRRIHGFTCYWPSKIILIDSEVKLKTGEDDAHIIMPAVQKCKEESFNSLYTTKQKKSSFVTYLNPLLLVRLHMFLGILNCA